MTSILLPISRFAGAPMFAFLLASAALAQTPEQHSLAPDRARPRQPTPLSVQQPESPQSTAEKSKSEADRKMREMDRRLSRTLRGVCIGC